MKRAIPILVVLVAALVVQPAHALWFRTKSIEWWTSVSDAVVVADVTAARQRKPRNENWNSQQVYFGKLEVLKGQPPSDLTVWQDYWHDEKNRGKTEVQALKPNDRVLLFWVRDGGMGKSELHLQRGQKGDAEVIFWVNLSKSDPRRSSQSAYDNDCAWLEDSQTILKIVKSRIAKEDPKHPDKRRGVIIEFADQDPKDEVHWEFVRTADPEYKKVLIKQLESMDEEEKESAIYNLASYPDEETIKLIRPFLTDPTMYETKVKIYPLRQMAYAALEILGDKPKRPEGYVSDPFLWLIGVGFEDDSSFPYLHLKRARK